MIPRSELPDTMTPYPRSDIVNIERRDDATLLMMDCGHALIEGKLHKYQVGENMCCFFCGPYANTPAGRADAECIASLLRTEAPKETGEQSLFF